MDEQERLMTKYHLAQANIGEMLGPLDDPIMAGFVNNLERINAVADAAPGFVWRLQTEDGDATALKVFDNNMLIINMSVWESVEALHQYTYHSDHAELLRQRRDWFTKMASMHMVMWWLPAGELPTIDDMKAKLDHINTHGPTPAAFTFKQRFTVEEMLAFERDSSR